MITLPRQNLLNNSSLGVLNFLKTIDIRLWVPLKIQDEFLGMIGLGKFLARDALEAWEKELLTTLAHQISIAIAYSQMVEGIQSEKFRLFMLAESAPQICQLLQPEEAAEQVVPPSRLAP